AGACGGWIDKYGYPFARGRVFDNCEKDEGQYNTAEQCFWATGAAMFVRSKVFHEAGGFDEFFFAHQEEIDLCWRLQKKGFKIYCEPASVVYHVGGGTLPVGNKRKVFLNFRNNLVMMRKNLPQKEAGNKILARLFLDGLAGIKYLLSGEPASTIAIVRAHIAYYKWKKDWKPGQLEEESSPNIAGKYYGSIVWQHYIRGKKTFRQIVGKK
ncbi:MAG: glycosyltransferase family 2 protein, partial [Chitinophagaceae bacterium]